MITGTDVFAKLTPGVRVGGVIPGVPVIVLAVQPIGQAALKITYEYGDGLTGQRLIYVTDMAVLTVEAPHEQRRRFDGDGTFFRLAAEALRIKMAGQFDPMLAVHTSELDALPHQIRAVYGELLPRTPLRFLLADDPGAGKTIMAGLYIKELILRGDLQRCLVVCPGSLAEQWQDELYRRFHLPFEILTNDKLEAARSGNWFLETSLIIARLDKLSRNEDVQEKLKAPYCR